MWFIRMIGWLLCGEGLKMRYCERTRRIRAGSLAGLRGGFLIFSEKGD